MKTTIKRSLLALAFTAALGAAAASEYGHGWRMAWRYAPDFALGFPDGAVLVFVPVVVTAAHSGSELD